MGEKKKRRNTGLPTENKTEKKIERTIEKYSDVKKRDGNRIKSIHKNGRNNHSAKTQHTSSSHDMK